MILGNQKQRNILSECSNSCYNPFKDEDETIKKGNSAICTAGYKELHGKIFLLSIDQSAMKYIMLLAERLSSCKFHCRTSYIPR